MTLRERLEGRQDIIPLSEYRLDWHNALVRLAKRYVGTPYVEKGRTYSGIDCCGLIIGILKGIQRGVYEHDNIWELIQDLEPVYSPVPGDLVVKDGFEIGIIMSDNKVIVCAYDKVVTIESWNVYPRQLTRFWQRGPANDKYTYYCLLKGQDHGRNTRRNP